MCFEGMEESGSEGLDELISEEKDKFFKGVDCVCISGKRCDVRGFAQGGSSFLRGQ